MARRDYLNDSNAPKANSIVPSVTAIDTAGVQHKSAALVLVSDAPALEALLQARWGAMKDALRRGDIARRLGVQHVIHCDPPSPRLRRDRGRPGSARTGPSTRDRSTRTERTASIVRTSRRPPFRS